MVKMKLWTRLTDIQACNKNIKTMGFRKEKDSIGYIDVPADKYWAAQTQRSLENFKIWQSKKHKEGLMKIWN